jgi:hypothetical protein
MTMIRTDQIPECRTVDRAVLAMTITMKTASVRNTCRAVGKGSGKGKSQRMGKGKGKGKGTGKGKGKGNGKGKGIVKLYEAGSDTEG